jgi:hypothetical protein
LNGVSDHTELIEQERMVRINNVNIILFCVWK